MINIIAQVFFTILGGAIAAVIGMKVADYKRHQDAFAEFKVALSELYGESLDSTRDLFSFHRDTLQRVRKALFRVLPFVRPANRAIMEKLWTKYQQVNHETLNPENESDWVQELYKISGETAPPKPTRVITIYLKKFSELTK